MARDLLQRRCTDAMGQTEWKDSAVVEALLGQHGVTETRRISSKECFDSLAYLNHCASYCCAAQVFGQTTMTI